MSDEHDDDGLSHLFGPPGETGKIPQPPKPEPEAAPEQPAPEPQPFSWDQVQPSWEQPTTALPAQDLPDAAPPAPEPAAAEPAAAAPDPLAWLNADPAGTIPASQPTSPAIPFTDQPTSAFTVPPYGAAQPDPFGAGAAAAALGAAPAEDMATRRYEPQPSVPAAAGAAAGSGGEPPAPGNRRLLIILGSVGGVLLIAIVILSVVLLTRGQPTAARSTSASASPSATPSTTATRSSSPSPTPTPSSPSPTPSASKSEAPPPPPPVPASPTVSASAGTTPDCKLLPDTANFTITYSSSNASSVQLLNPAGAILQTVTAGQPFQEVGYTCKDASEDWKVVAVGDSAAKPPTASATVTVKPTAAVGQGGTSGQSSGQ
jgi:hypothetical protein